MSKPRSQAVPPGIARHGLPMGPLVKEVLKIAYRARLPVLLEGPTGIGKSEIVAQAAEDLEIGYVVLDLSLLEPPDLVGLPIIADGRTSYAPPRILPQDGSGILMLEELNRAERYIQQPALQLLTARRLHEYKLPEGWTTCAAINPEKGDYQVTPLDPALRSRFMNLVVRADRECWLTWAEANDVHPAVLDVARHHDHVLDDVPPRTWTYVSNLLRRLEGWERSEEPLLRASLGGYLPAAWVEVLLDALEQSAPEDGFDVRRLLQAYDTEPTLQKAVAELHRQGRTDVLEAIGYRVLGVVDGPRLHQAIQRKEFRLESLERLLLDLPGDHREQIQECLSDKVHLATLLNIKPADLVRSYPGSRLADQVQLWARDPARGHRVGLLVAALCQHLKEKVDVTALRSDRGAMTSLGLFRSHVAPRWSPPLEETFEKLNLQPLGPGKK